MTETKSNEISLVDLWKILTSQKSIFFYAWLACITLGIVYVLVAKPVYQAEAFLLPPTMQDIQPLNITISNNSNKSNSYNNANNPNISNDAAQYGQYNPKQVYNLFVQTLNSRANRKKFYEANNIASKLGYEKGNEVDFFERNFHDKLIVSRNLKNKELEGFVSISFEGPDAELASQWVNDFVDVTVLHVRSNLIREVFARLESDKRDVKDAIAGKLLLAQKRRADRVIELKEALVVAKALSEHDRQANSRLRSDGLTMNTDNLPLYMLSEAVLEAEINVLEGRKDDAPFIEGLRDLEEYVATLEQVQINEERVSPAFIDQKAFVEEIPIKPKKKLVVILAGLLGLLLGVIASFIRHGMNVQREED